MGMLQSHLWDVIILEGILPQNQSQEYYIPRNIFPKLIPNMGIFIGFPKSYSKPSTKHPQIE